MFKEITSNSVISKFLKGLSKVGNYIGSDLYALKDRSISDLEKEGGFVYDASEIVKGMIKYTGYASNGLKGLPLLPFSHINNLGFGNISSNTENNINISGTEPNVAKQIVGAITTSNYNTANTIQQMIWELVPNFDNATNNGE